MSAVSAATRSRACRAAIVRPSRSAIVRSRAFNAFAMWPPNETAPNAGAEIEVMIEIASSAAKNP